MTVHNTYDSLIVMLKKISWIPFILLGLVVSLCFAPDDATAELKLLVSEEKGNIEKYQALLAEKGLPATSLTDLKSIHADRSVAEIVIVQQALEAAGIDVELEFIEVPNTARSRVMVRDGEVVMSTQSFFSIAIVDDVMVSSPFISEGAFVKGVYGLKNNRTLMDATDLARLKLLKAVSSKGWKVDWFTLEGLELNELRHVPRYSMMFDLIGAQKVDFALMEFPASDDFTLELNGIELHPVPGIKVGLSDSRHFTVSKKHPMGLRVFNALEKGLAILKEKGVVDRYLREVGFYNHRVDDWKLLNP